jgi:hypothetical protein
MGYLDQDYHTADNGYLIGFSEQLQFNRKNRKGETRYGSLSL